MPRLNNLIEHFHLACAVMAEEADLSPANSRVCACLAGFVRAVLDSPVRWAELDACIDAAARQGLLDRLSRAEYLMEKAFAADFISRPRLSLGDLNDFWYRDNYRELAADEVMVLRDHDKLKNGNKTSKTVFVGSGPLPLTALDFFHQTGRDVICLEHDAEAAMLSRALIGKLGLADHIRIIDARGEDYDYAQADIVFIAAMVGRYPEVVERVRRTAPDACLCVRSAQDARLLLYREADLGLIESKGYRLEGTSRLTPRVVNTTHIMTPVHVKGTSVAFCAFVGC